MLMAHPTVLQKLVERYESLRLLAESEGTEGVEGVSPGIAEQLGDTAYTLCVSTGEREIGRALDAARDHIARSVFDARGAQKKRKKEKETPVA